MSEKSEIPYEEILAGYQQALNNASFDAVQGFLSEELPINGLLVNLDQDNTLQLVTYFLGELMEYSEQEDVLPEGFDFLQIFLQFPFQIVPDAIPDLARLLLMINWSTPVGCFGLNEVQGILYYRHVFQYIEEPVAAAVFVEAVDTMAHYVDQYKSMLQTVASGEQTLSDILAELEDEGRKAEVFPGYDL